MKRWILPALASVAAILGIPSICHAHSLYPTYFPLGPYTLILPFTVPAGFLSVLMVIGTHAAILRYTVSNRDAIGNLWRAGVAFFASKAGESIPGFAILSGAPWIMWSSNSKWETVGAPLLIFGVGVVLNVVLIWALFRKERPDAAKIVGTASLLSVSSYLILLLSILAMLQVGWMK